MHQEVLLAALFKLYSFRLAPIFFYTYSVFFLQGVFLSALYLIRCGRGSCCGCIAMHQLCKQIHQFLASKLPKCLNCSLSDVN